MNLLTSYPFVDDIAHMERYCKLPLHQGRGTVEIHGDPNNPFDEMLRHFRRNKDGDDPVQEAFDVSFLVPVTGNCLLFLRWPTSCPLSRNFGTNLTVVGESSEGPFRLECPRYYVRTHSSRSDAPGWAIAAPVYKPSTLIYGSPRPIARVTATINNLDFEEGNVADFSGRAGQRSVLRVEASGRAVDFSWRKDRVHLRRLLEGGLLTSTSLVTFSFASWPDASEQDLAAFAHAVASLCGYATGQHTGIPVLSFFDSEGQVVKRFIGDAIESDFRLSRYSFTEDYFTEGFTKLFHKCFAEHQKMQNTSHWQRMAALYPGIEDPTFLEEKYATLMMGVELLLRNSLIEHGTMTQKQAEGMTLASLIGAARNTLRWDMPRHYTEGERYRLTRNAVNHGNELPHHPHQVRHDFDKWRRFLLRRLLIRLGYDGKISSAQRGYSLLSKVDDFSEDENSFHP